MSGPDDTPNTHNTDDMNDTNEMDGRNEMDGNQHPADGGGPDPTEELLTRALGNRADAGGAPIDETGAWQRIEGGVASGRRGGGPFAARGPLLAVAAAVVLILAIGLGVVARRDSGTVYIGPSHPPSTGTLGSVPDGPLLLDRRGIGPYRFGDAMDSVAHPLVGRWGLFTRDERGADPDVGTRAMGWGGLTLYFTDARFDGWKLAGDQSATPTGVLLPEGITLGMTAIVFEREMAATGQPVQEAGGPAFRCTQPPRVCGAFVGTDAPESTPGGWRAVAFGSGSGADRLDTAIAQQTGTTVPDTTPIAQKVELHGDGIDGHVFGEDAQPVIDDLTAKLGAPTSETAYSGPGLYDYRLRGVHWGALGITIAEKDGRDQFVAWEAMHNQPSDPELPANVAVPHDLNLRITAQQYQDLGLTLTAQGAEGADLWCFTDRTGKVCAAFDPPWNNSAPFTDAPAPTAIVVAYAAGLGAGTDPSGVASTTAPPITPTTGPTTTTSTPPEARGVPTPPVTPTELWHTRWRFADGFQSTPTATSLDLQLNYVECVGVTVPGDTLTEPVVQETADAVVITFFAARPPMGGFQTCPLPAGTPRTVTLREPLGTRTLYVGIGGVADPYVH